MDTRELIERLKVQVEIGLLGAAELHGFKVASYDECAGALSSQDAEIEMLREALKPFADYCDDLNGFLDNHNQPLPDDDGPGWVYVKVGDFRRARAALTPKPNKEG